jgi:hypothetical protein
MSVRMEVYLVRWDEFQALVLKGDELELRREAIDRGLIDEDELWNWELSALVESANLDFESSRSPFAFMDAFDRFKRSWKSDGRLHFNEVFDTLFWECRGDSHQIMELEEGEDVDLFGIDTALRPETVRELLETATKIQLEECRPFFKAKNDDSRFGSFDDWLAYGEEWRALLGRAAEEGKGLIVAMFG